MVRARNHRSSTRSSYELSTLLTSTTLSSNTIANIRRENTTNYEDIIPTAYSNNITGRDEHTHHDNHIGNHLHQNTNENKTNNNNSTTKLKLNESNTWNDSSIEDICSINTKRTQQKITIHNRIIHHINNNHESKQLNSLYHDNNINQNRYKFSNEYIPRIEVKDNNNSEPNYNNLRYIGCQYTQRNNNENNNNTNINDHLIHHDNRIGDILHQNTNDINKKKNNNSNNQNSNNSTIRNVN